MIEKFNTCHSSPRRLSRKFATVIILLVVPLIIVLAAWILFGVSSMDFIQAATPELMSP